MRILFAEEGDGVGGSVVSLYYLLRGLMRRGVEPVVTFPAPHEYSARLLALGAEVLHPGVPSEGRGGRAASPRTGAETAVPPAWTESPLYRTLSFYYRHASRRGARKAAWEKMLKQVRPEAVYGNNDLPLNFDLAAAADALGLPVYCHLRGFQPLRWPHRRFARRLKGGIAISDVIREHYLRAGFSSAQITRVHNGIDVADYPYRDPQADIPPAGGRLLFLGRLAGWKGAPVLLRAVARLGSTRPDLTLTIAGEGPARSAWEAEAERLGVGERCRFVGHVGDIPRWLHEADLLVHASTEPEPFGRVLLEGMAAGTPVVASDLGATREIIDDGRSGFLVPAGRPLALAEAIEALLGDPARRISIARAARLKVETHFSAGAMVSGVARVLGLASPAGAVA